MELSFSSIIGVAVGLAVVYYILSLIVSSITNQITKLMDLRAKDLLVGLHELISDPSQLEKLMNNRLIANLKTKRIWSPSKMERKVGNKTITIPHVEGIPARDLP